MIFYNLLKINKSFLFPQKKSGVLDEIKKESQRRKQSTEKYQYVMTMWLKQKCHIQKSI